MLLCPLKYTQLEPKLSRLTLQNVDCGAVVSLLDHTAAFGQAGGVHTVHDGEDLHTLAHK